jgi:hypothetical protein
MKIERRKDERVSLSLPVRFKVFDLARLEKDVRDQALKVPAEAQDLSLGGIQVVSEEPLREGDVLELEFEVPGSGRVRTVAQMAWVREGAEGRYSGGVRFIPVYEEDLEKIRVYFQKG